MITRIGMTAVMCLLILIIITGITGIILTPGTIRTPGIAGTALTTIRFIQVVTIFMEMVSTLLS